MSLRHAKPVPQSVLPYLSRIYHVNTYNQERRTGVGIDAGVIKSNHSTYLPRDAAIT